jgi:CBS domain-containing protein
MNVAAILKQKGRAVTTAKPTTTLMEVANKLAAKRIGAIVIVGARGEVAGIISERDIVRALSVVGFDCLTQPVSQSMTRNVVTCLETDTLEELMAMMTARRFRHLPVMADDALVAHHLHGRHRQAPRGRSGDGGHSDARVHYAHVSRLAGSVRRASWLRDTRRNRLLERAVHIDTGKVRF